MSSPFRPCFRYQCLIGCLSVLAIGGGFSPLVHAQDPVESSADNRLSFSEAAQPGGMFVAPFTPPTDDEQTDSRAGGSRRITQQCRQDPPVEVGLTALAPVNQVGLTASSQPTVFVYLPETTAQHLYLSFEAVTGDVHAEKIVPIPTSGGLVALELPLPGAALVPGQTYRWGVSLLCPSGQTDMPWDEGYLQQVSLPTAPATAKAPLTSVQQLGQHGLWYDTLAELVRLQSLSVSPIAQASIDETWNQMLNWAELTELVNQPLAPADQ